MTTAQTMTRKRMGELARQARRYGCHRPNNGYSLYVYCPLCGEKVETPYSPAHDRSIPKTLDRAVIYHLEDCPKAEDQ
jgi:hypothetical protein